MVAGVFIFPSTISARHTSKETPQMRQADLSSHRDMQVETTRKSGLKKNILLLHRIADTGSFIAVCDEFFFKI